MKKNILEKLVFLTLIITFILDFLFNEKTNFRYENILNITYFLSSITIIYLQNKKHNFKYYFIFYILLVFYLSFSRTSHYNYYMYNIIPFKTILSIKDNSSIIKTLFFNFSILMPLAFIFPKMNDKLKEKKNYIITIIFIAILIKSCGYILHYSILDIDDILLNILGAIIAFYILRNNKVNSFINKLNNITLKEKTSIILFIIVYLIFISISSFKIIGSLVSMHANYYRDYSHLTCFDNNKTYLGEKNNYRYYSKCNYKDSYIIAGNRKYSVKEYFESFYFKESDTIKMLLEREIIINNVKVKEKKNVIKRIYNSRNQNKLYLVNIDEITLTKDNVLYEINDDSQNDIDLYSIVKFTFLKNYNQYGYILYKGDYYNIINIFKLDNNEYFEFIIPTNYQLNENVITKLYLYAKKG